MPQFKQLLWVLFFLWMGATGCSSFFYYPVREPLTDLKKMHVRAPLEITFTSLDDVLLHGWYFKNNIRASPKGVLVYFHGNAENITTHFANLHWILDYGYDYFIFDYQGYGKSGGQPSPKATVEDGKAAILWVAHHHPSVPLIVFGQSLGGAIALRVVADLKEEIPISHVVVDSTFLSYRKEAREVLARHWLTWLLQPLAYLTMSDRYAPMGAVADISPIPLLIFHGDHDRVVPFALGEEIYKKAKAPKEFIRVYGGQHGDLFWREKGRYRKELLRRLNPSL